MSASSCNETSGVDLLERELASSSPLKPLQKAPPAASGSSARIGQRKRLDRFQQERLDDLLEMSFRIDRSGRDATCG